MYVGGPSEMVSGNLEVGFICLWLRFYLTPGPSPARFSRNPEFKLAGKGGIRKRGRSPLLIFLPLSDTLIGKAGTILLIGEGEKGEFKRGEAILKR